MGSHGSKQREEKAKQGQEKPIGAAMVPSTKYILVPVALLTFDPTRKGGEGEWVPRGPPQASPSPSDAAMPSGLPPGQSAVIVSFNVWFDSRAKRSRFSALLDEVLAQDPVRSPSPAHPRHCFSHSITGVAVPPHTCSVLRPKANAD